MTVLRELLLDAGFALRLGRRRGGTAALIVVTLALGIGVATTFASAVDTILFRPLPISQPDRVVSLFRVDKASGRPDGVAPGTIVDWRERTRSFAVIAGAEPYSYAYDYGAGPVSVGAWRVSEGYFDIFRVQPVVGRLLGDADFEADADAVAVVSYPFWTTRFGSDSAVIGTMVRLGSDRIPYRIVGVLPSDFPYMDGRDLYVPQPLVGQLRQNRFSNYYPTFGRLTAHASLESAEADVQAVSAVTAAEFPESDAGWTASLVMLDASITAGVRPGLLLLLLASVLILLIACVNAASLIVAEGARRSRELAVRAALGAGSWRIVRQMIAEVGLLALGAGVLGIGIAMGGLAAFRQFAPAGIPRLNELQVDLTPVALGALAAIIVAIVVAVPPVMRVGGADLRAALKAGGRGALQSPQSVRLRSILVTVQVALAVVVLGGAGLLLRSWMAITATEQGYHPAGVVGAEAHFWGSQPTEEARLAFVEEVVRRLNEQPGVRASVASSLPLSSGIGNEDAEVQIPGSTESIEAFGVIVGSGFFELLSVPILDGRSIDADIRAEGDPVVVISTAVADRLWPGGDAVGALIQVSYGGPPQLLRVIGVVGDVRFQSLEREQGPTVYLPYVQAPTGSLFVVAGGAQPAVATDPLVRGVLRDIAPTMPFGQVVHLDQQVWSAGKGRRFSLMILAAFGAVSVLLTAIGLFGLMAHMIRTRARELGIRLALGAWPAQLRRLVLRQAATLVGTGVVAGVALFLLGGGLMRGMVYGVVTDDPLTIVAVAMVVVFVALGAVWRPAKMATRINPAAALRAD